MASRERRLEETSGQHRYQAAQGRNKLFVVIISST